MTVWQLWHGFIPIQALLRDSPINTCASGTENSDKQHFRLFRQSYVINNAGLDGWEDGRHPAPEGIGSLDQAYDPIVSTETIETLLTQSAELDDSGWSFAALRNHDRAAEFDGVARGAYVLEAPDEASVAIPDSLGETAQAELGVAGSAVVTFQPDIAEEYPSIRLLLPGDPMFGLLSSIAAETDAPNVEMICGIRNGSTAEVVSRSGKEDIKSAAVVAPATTDSTLTDLLGAGSLDNVDAAEQAVLDWLSDLSD